ncbi:MAG: transposase [Methanosarcinaceae archaeon]|nr:transposase [Methanosarcinaceae archaeon]
MGFNELSDEQWKFIKRFLPPQLITGRKRVDDRKVINGILFVLITGCRWRDMPPCYGCGGYSMEKIEKVVRRRNMESDHRISSGFCISGR